MTRQPTRRELLTAGSAATLGAVWSRPASAAETLTWRRLPDLPQTLGGQFAGVHNGALIVAGGSHFPQSRWTGGVKKWVDSVFVLTGVDAAWRTFRLPTPLAYGGSVSTEGGLLLIGGGVAEKNSGEVLRLRWTGAKIEVSRGPSLPVALANCVAVRIGGRAWLVGGQESPTATATSRALLSLDLNDAKAGWRTEAPIPGAGRILPAAAAVDGKLFVASGADLYAEADGKPARRYLRDAWCFTPGKGWAQLPDMPRVACAAPALGSGDDFLVFGGSDGILAPREMELRDAHPGFCKDLLVLRTGATAWSRAADLPAGIVTTTAALWDGMMVIPGGEDRPAHRSAAVFGYRYAPPASLQAAALPAVVASVAATAPASRPNILWICTDQQRWDTITSLGNPYIRTPNIDRLAREGVAFTHAYCQNPICTPSRASFLTGCRPSRIHQHRNGNATFPEELTSRLITRRLASAGYDGALCGKFHLSSPFDRVEPRFHDGYRLFEWSHHPAPEPGWPLAAHAYQQWLSQRGASWAKLYKARKIAGYPDAYNAGMPAEHHEITWAADRTEHSVAGGLKAPWFASINLFAPHPPFDPAPEYLERMEPRSLPAPLYRQGEEREQARFSQVDHQTPKPVPPGTYQALWMKAAYYAMIEHIDWYVGRVLDVLERTGQRTNTLVVFTSDHGEMMGDHCLRLKGCRFFEGAMRVPLILSWPGGGLKGGTINDALVELTDIAPTLLDAAGIANPGDMDGKSLLGLARGEGSGGAHREFVRAEYHDSLDLPDHSHASMIRDRRHKLTLYHGHGLGELFDLQADPNEFDNLFEKPDHAAVRRRLTDMLLDSLALGSDLGTPRIGKY